MVNVSFLVDAIDRLGTVIAEFDDHMQTAEAAGLGAHFRTAILEGHPRRGELLSLLGRDPPRARAVAEEILSQAQRTGGSVPAVP